ncbi:MAG: ABC transporter permease, partial [Candidatus Methanoperedens sp.]|nr:ABC transporter permease [Candidatus Methanoperedens sp.]
LIHVFGREGDMRLNLRFIWESKLLTIGIIIFLLICLISIIQPILLRALIGDLDPMEVGSFPLFDPISATHPLGTDRYGRDVMALLLLGLRYSLSIGLLSGLISTIIGTIVGLITGFYGGWVDTILRSGTDMILVIPTLPLLITLSAYIRGLDVVTMALLLAAFSWPFSARTIRAQVLSLRERNYVDLARASGMSKIEIIFLEIMPNLLPYLGVSLAASVVGAILAEFGLEIIGLGPDNIATLGLMINWAIGWGSMSLGKWALIAAPAGVLILIFLSLNLINIGLEQTFNPRLKGTTGL